MSGKPGKLWKFIPMPIPPLNFKIFNFENEKNAYYSLLHSMVFFKKLRS
jgi:hypothetical protein